MPTARVDPAVYKALVKLKREWALRSVSAVVRRLLAQRRPEQAPAPATRTPECRDCGIPLLVGDLCGDRSACRHRVKYIEKATK